MGHISKLNDDMSIKIPKEILLKSGLKPGTEVIWLYDSQGQIILMEKPKDFAKVMRGLGKKVWDDLESDTYIEKERDSWG